VLQLEALEEFIVRICTKSTAHIALRVVWSMMGYYEDTLQLNAPTSLLSRRARIVRLTLHVEAAVQGDVTAINPEILHIFTIPSEAQLALVQREWELVQSCRAHKLLRPFPPMTPYTKLFGGEADACATGAGDGKAAATGGEPAQPDPPQTPGSVMERLSFSTQMKFVKELTDTAESLRHIDVR
jgi:hypothetical protein